MLQMVVFNQTPNNTLPNKSAELPQKSKQNHVSELDDWCHDVDF